jgi:DNA-binding response OmpR family regulator
MTARRSRRLDGHRILVVEDEYFIADDLSRALQRQGAEVIGPVPDLAAGLVLAEHEQLDGAVLDVNLGGDMSYPIADALGARGVPFLFTTGYDDWALTSDYRGICRIEKPFDINVVLTALDELVVKRAHGETKP